MKETLLKIVRGIMGILLIFFLIKWGMQIQNKQDEKYPWTASIYTETQILDSKEFESVEKCREWIAIRRDALDSAYERWDYDCGYKCTFEDQSIESGKKVNLYECEEVTK